MGRAWRIRAAPRARRRPTLAGHLHRGQPVAGAGARPGAGRARLRHAGQKRRCAVPADARGHRGRADRQSRRGQGAARCAEGARHPPGARRFRHRLFQSDLSAALQLRQAQDRPWLCRSARPRCRQQRAGAGDRGARPRARPHASGRGRRDRGAARAAAARRLRGDAGLSCSPAPAPREALDRLLAEAAPRCRPPWPELRLCAL